MKTSILLCLVGLLFVGIVHGQPASALISNLPGLQDKLNFSMYAGYVPVGTNNYFYWFIESEHSPKDDPVVLWLNGGPGCSSLGGLMSENGPFYPDGNGDLVLNPYSWNRMANMLYLESPAGVGFSYCPEDNCPEYDDNSTASDNYNFLVSWFKLYTQFQSNDFYITGESYAGHYIPELTLQIYQHMKTNPKTPPQSNFKGFAAGNPLSDEGYDLEDNYLNTYLQTHGVIQLGDTDDDDVTGNFNPYDILVDVCDSDKIRNHIRFPHPINHMKGLRPDESNPSTMKRFVPNPPDCIDDWVQNYLDESSVQTSIHAQSTQWVDCGGPEYDFSTESMIPLYRMFMANTDWKIWVYSGDADTVLNFIATEAWILNQNMTVVSPWNVWYYSQIDGTSQIGGWNVQFDRLPYTTVKGAGHMVPWFQPAPAFQLFTSFLQQ